MALKIDVHKAFDSMSLDFLMEVMKFFGFSTHFCSWILTILHSARISIALNGLSRGYFKCERGVRQGDPLSSLLFCIGEDFLIRWLSARVTDGDFLPMVGCNT